MQHHHSVLDTLVYLFDYLVYEKKQRPSVAEMHEELDAAGFDKKLIERAMSWLLDLNDMQEGTMMQSPTPQAIRRFTDAEAAKISAEGRDFLLKLTYMGVIDTRLREILIQKLMTLDEEDISVDEVTWVALMATFNRPGQEANAVWLERALLEEEYVTPAH